MEFQRSTDLRIHSSDVRSGFDGGLGKVCYGSDNSGDSQFTVNVAEANLLFEPKFSCSWSGRLHVKYSEEQRTAIDVVEAFIDYRKVMNSGFRFNTKVGAFFPPISVENRSTAWASPYTLTPSAINTWIGEELRTIGVESSLEKEFNDHRFGATIALYRANDPAGLLLSYRGWALHDHEVGLNDHVRVARGLFFVDKFNVDKKRLFQELDGDWGYYVGLNWNYLRDTEFKVLYYNNRANPTKFNGREYAWHTRFVSVSFRHRFSNDLEILSQFMHGDTLMGFENVVWTNPEYNAAYIMFSKPFGKHRISLRYDNFRVDDKDTFARDPNRERGYAWTFAYKYKLKSKQQIIFEALQVNSRRPARAIIDVPVKASETQLQLSYRIFF